MIHNLTDTDSILHQFLGELRDHKIQTDRMRFRKNVERIGNIMAYEVSKFFNYSDRAIETPLGATTFREAENRIVLATILRAGLPFHHGFLQFFDNADNAFVAALRRHHKDGSFYIKADYITTPNLDNCILIIVDPMLATGASIKTSVELLLEHGTPKEIHVATIIASTDGVQYIRREFPKAHIWAGAIDEELTGKSYIVPGLGDAGDLAYGPKEKSDD
ncbi:MAG TPA: uracil phosphoribosyltransferase [Saprospiraceae bacterium]|nr:uracil phosphoribosyltransferase [Saprospiraceae bacterium]